MFVKVYDRSSFLATVSYPWGVAAGLHRGRAGPPESSACAKETKSGQKKIWFFEPILINIEEVQSW
jgi:hypothetical protein